jgi:hypothetical protein
LQVVWTFAGIGLRLCVLCLQPVFGGRFDFSRRPDLVGFLVRPRFFTGSPVSGVDASPVLIFSLVRGGMCKLLTATLGVALCSTARPRTHPDGGIVGQKS